MTRFGKLALTLGVVGGVAAVTGGIMTAIGTDAVETAGFDHKLLDTDAVFHWGIHVCAVGLAVILYQMTVYWGSGLKTWWMQAMAIVSFASCIAGLAIGIGNAVFHTLPETIEAFTISTNATEYFSKVAANQADALMLASILLITIPLLMIVGGTIWRRCHKEAEDV